MTTEFSKRKLTTILAADVVNYSQMMAADEDATLETLKAYRVVTESLVEKHNGRVFNTAGDAFLAEFDSAVEAVRCAISIQEDLAFRNSQLSEDRRMWFRIGINVGDVIIEKDDLFGDGVNVAARLEGLAEKGGICISGSTFEQVKNKLSIAFDDIGAQKVKNIPDPVPAYRLVPGQIAVRNTEESTAPRHLRPHSWLFVNLGFVTLIILVGGAYVAGFIPSNFISNGSFDGRWRVTVSSLSGCLNNNPRSYTINVEDGNIDEPGSKFPKKGTISENGEFHIESNDVLGQLLNRQTGRIVDDIGKGRFQGRKPDCHGNVTMERLY